MFCTNCGSQLENGVKFCPMCGASQIYEETTEVSSVVNTSAETGAPVSGATEYPVADVVFTAPVSATESIVSQTSAQGDGKQTGKKEKSKWKSSHPILGVFLSVLIVLTMTTGFMLLVARGMISKDGINDVVTQVDFKKISVDIDGEGKKTIYDFLGNQPIVVDHRIIYLSEEKIDKLLEKKYVKNFISDKMYDFVEDALYHTGEGVLDEKEFRKFLEKNRDDLGETISYFRSLSKSDIDYIIGVCNQYQLFEKVSVESLTEDYQSEISLAGTVVSIWLVIVFFCVAVFLTLLIFLMEKNRVKGLMYTGINLIVSGVLVLGISILGANIVKSLNSSIKLGRKVWETVAGMLQSSGMKVGGIVIGTGVACILVYTVVHVIVSAVDRKKATK